MKSISATAAPAAEGGLDSQIARTIYLLSQAATVGVCRGRMRSVISQLHRMADQPGLSTEVRSTCLKVLEDWHQAQLEHFPETVDASAVAATSHH